MSPFAFLQKIGKSLMLPVAVLPVAGLLLGIGAADFGWMPELMSSLMKHSGESLPLTAILPELTRAEQERLLGRDHLRAWPTEKGQRFLNTLLERFLP